MMLPAAFVAVVLSLSAWGLPSPNATRVHVARYAGRANHGSYVVTLKPGVDKTALISSLNLTTITHGDDWDPLFVHGFAGTFDDATVGLLSSNPGVEGIEEEGYFEPTAVQTNAPWGLARLSSFSPGSSGGTYQWLDAYQGRGVDIYVVDSGILHTLAEFGGRARQGWAAPGLTATDESGHGTWLAGIAIGKTYGVAKAASAVAVRIFGASGTSTTATIITGLNYVGSAAASSGRPSIALLAFGGSGSTAIDNAVTALTSAGIPVVVAAGNSNSNVSQFSPAHVASAVTVGASTAADAKAAYSNIGAGIDYFAPGDQITSVWIGTGTSAINTLSGTSGSAAHVAGLYALWQSQYGTFAGGVWHQDGVLSGIPAGTPNILAVGPIQV